MPMTILLLLSSVWAEGIKLANDIVLQGVTCSEEKDKNAHCAHYKFYNNIGDSQQCQSRCKQDQTNCAYYTYSERHRYCWLKKTPCTLKSISPSHKYVSGGCSTPTPAPTPYASGTNSNALIHSLQFDEKMTELKERFQSLKATLETYTVEECTLREIKKDKKNSAPDKLDLAKACGEYAECYAAEKKEFDAAASDLALLYADEESIRAEVGELRLLKNVLECAQKELNKEHKRDVEDCFSKAIEAGTKDELGDLTHPELPACAMQCEQECKPFK